MTQIEIWQVIFPVVCTAKQLMFTAASIILVTVCLYSLGVLLKTFLYKILKQGFRASHGRKTRLCNTSLPKLLFSLPQVSGEASLRHCNAPQAAPATA